MSEKSGQAQTDPYGVCDLNLCSSNAKLNRRERVVGLSRGTRNEKSDVTVPIKFKKIGDGLYLITTTDRLKDGEYFFSNPLNKVVYAFAVD